MSEVPQRGSPERMTEDGAVANFLPALLQEATGCEGWEEVAAGPYPLIVYNFMRPGARVDMLDRRRRLVNRVWQIRAITRGMDTWHADEIAEVIDRVLGEVLYLDIGYGCVLQHVRQVTPVRYSARDASSQTVYRNRGGDYEFCINRPQV